MQLHRAFSSLPEGLWGCILLLLMFSGCARRDPIAVAKEIYSNHYDFVLLEEELSPAKDLLTPRFYDVLMRAKKQMAEGNLYIGMDVWTDAQDGYISGPVEFRVARQEKGTAVVHMVYDFKLEEVEKNTTMLMFVRSGADSRWRLDDLAGPETHSTEWTFSRLLEAGPPDDGVADTNE